MSAGDAIGGIVVDVIKGGVWLTWMGGTALYNLMKTPLAVQLQRLTPKEEWGDKIEGFACVRCQTVNERHRTRCFECGQEYRHR